MPKGGPPHGGEIEVDSEPEGGPDRDEVHWLSRWRLLEKVPWEEVGIVNRHPEVSTKVQVTNELIWFPLMT